MVIKMNQTERRTYLIKTLLKEQPRYAKMRIPSDTQEQKNLLRSLMNIRMPGGVDEEFLRVQDEYLQQVNSEKGIVTLADMEEMQSDLYVWQGDITRLRVGAIVNAANSGMTGCYQPCHSCIDNCIHTYAGIQLRLKCAEMMEAQGYEEPTGMAKITPAYNLPCDFVIHTVGPIVQGRLTKEHEKLLQSCYQSCLAIAEENSVQSLAFCCISTGVFMFPNERAAEIAVRTVKEYKEKSGSSIKVVFNVFKDMDLAFYQKLLQN
jgi:O-acetyl-ADP-ribose deacetylase (regulator of RNase III)